MGLVQRVKKAVTLEADESKHERVDIWSNRDLIPLPPSRQTWGWFNFFGSWSLSALSIATWQGPNTYLTQGLSVRQAMAVIVVSRGICLTFATLAAWCGLTWHIGFTIQNRFTWGMRGSYIPLIQRAMLNFIWNALQCWTGGKLMAVCLTAIWPSFYTMKNTIIGPTGATNHDFIGFLVFWCLSVPFLFVRVEKFKLPFMISCSVCGIGMFCMLVWALSTAKTLGPLFHTGTNVPEDSRVGIHWLMMYAINQAIGGIVAGMTNSSDFSRYATSKKDYLVGTISVYWIVGVIVSVAGLLTTSAAQVIYGEVYWNPPDLLMVMMDKGHGSAGSRAAVFFLAAAFSFTALFENVCGNAVAGGIDLAGMFPLYIDIRRGALITFTAAWIIQPWQLNNKATTFVQVLNSFSVFLAPVLGVILTDFFILRRKKIRLSQLYVGDKTSKYWFFHGVNLRVIPAWLAGWAPTIGGMIETVSARAATANLGLLKVFHMSFFVGMGISATVFYGMNLVWPVEEYVGWDEVDVYGTFTEREAKKLGVKMAEGMMEGVEGVEGEVIRGKDEEKGSF